MIYPENIHCPKCNTPLTIYEDGQIDCPGCGAHVISHTSDDTKEMERELEAARRRIAWQDEFERQVAKDAMAWYRKFTHAFPFVAVVQEAQKEACELKKRLPKREKAKLETEIVQLKAKISELEKTPHQQTQAGVHDVTEPARGFKVEKHVAPIDICANPECGHDVAAHASFDLNIEEELVECHERCCKCEQFVRRTGDQQI